MRRTNIVLAIGALSLAQPGMSAVMRRNTVSDPFIIEFFAKECGDMTSGEYSSFGYFTSHSEPNPGDCVGPGFATWQSATVQQDSAADYVVDFYAGEGCTDFIFTVSDSGCITSPEGQSLVSAIVRLA